jgi:hypothetical protein
VLCSTNTSNGDHCHPLVVTMDDVNAGQFVFTLEDGGTGHTHTVNVESPYGGYSYLQPGYPVEFVSENGPGHEHTVLITCPL